MDDKETAKTLNDLARHKAILRLLTDVRIDMEICEIEGWNKLEYLNQLKELINSMGNIMNDLISRQDAIDLLDEQIAICDRALTNPGISMNDEFAVKVEKRSLIAYREKLECLLSAKSEIVKCKDCEWWTRQTCSVQGRCALLGIYPTGAWYCGNARRK
jgi:hypothetical protein